MTDSAVERVYWLTISPVLYQSKALYTSWTGIGITFSTGYYQK